MRYLEQLKALKNAQKGPEHELTELTKAPSVSFVSSLGEHFSEKDAANGSQSISAQHGIGNVIERACAGLPLTPERFLGFLSAEDLDDIRSGDLTPEGLRAYAELWARGKGYICH